MLEEKHIFLHVSHFKKLPPLCPVGFSNFASAGESLPTYPFHCRKCKLCINSTFIVCYLCVKDHAGKNKHLIRFQGI